MSKAAFIDFGNFIIRTDDIVTMRSNNKMTEVFSKSHNGWLRSTEFDYDEGTQLLMKASNVATYQKPQE